MNPRFRSAVVILVMSIFGVQLSVSRHGEMPSPRRVQDGRKAPAHDVRQEPDDDVAVVAAPAPRRTSRVAPATHSPSDAGPSAARSSQGFPIGWYDSLVSPSSLPAMAVERMNAVMPYDAANADPAAYLDTARSSGIRVLLEVPRRLVKAGDMQGVARFVSTYRRHPALLGWYLADEPTVNEDVGPLAPDRARAFYDAIKAADASHPVAIAFGGSEDPGPYRDAMDVMMYDRYPCWRGEPEFRGVEGWMKSLRRVEQIARSEEGFFPVIQGYGDSQTDGLFGLRPSHRLPTPGELRYMAFSALQSGATGVFFWARYRSSPDWINDVLVPVVRRMKKMERALAGGPIPDLAKVAAPDVGATVFRDPIARVWYIVAVHHADGTAEGSIALSGRLAEARTATLLTDEPRRVAIADGKLPLSLDRYAVNVYRLQ